MTTRSPDVTAALASLQARWGAAAPRRFGEVVGALATVPAEEPAEGPAALPSPGARSERILSTGFTALDAILGPGGLPRGTGVSLRGDLSSGRTTLALRLVAESQAAGSIVAWLDVSRSFDPVEAVARGVRLEWLVVVVPETLAEALAIAGSLLAGRTVDLLLVDLLPRPDTVTRPAVVADRLRRLGALARRASATLVLLEPPGLVSGLAGAAAESTGIRLELARRSWIRLGRDVVGQRTEVVVGRSHLGPPGRRAELRILYADGGWRDACLRRDGLLAELLSFAPANPVPGISTDATSPSPRTAPPARSRPSPLRLVAGGADRPRRPALDGRDGPRRGPDRPRPRHPAGDPARERPPARA